MGNAQELWAEVGDIVVKPAIQPDGKGINADLLMLAAGCIFGASLTRINNQAMSKTLRTITFETCRNILGRVPGKFTGELPEFSFEIASEIIVRIMPELEALKLKNAELASIMAGWIGTWAAKFDAYGVPAEEFIAVSRMFAETVATIDKWSLHDPQTGDCIGTWTP